jgi:hypothetical protein
MQREEGTVYGAVTNGLAWLFLKAVSVQLPKSDRPMPPPHEQQPRFQFEIAQCSMTAEDAVHSRDDMRIVCNFIRGIASGIEA